MLLGLDGESVTLEERDKVVDGRLNDASLVLAKILPFDDLGRFPVHEVFTKHAEHFRSFVAIGKATPCGLGVAGGCFGFRCRVCSDDGAIQGCVEVREGLSKRRILLGDAGLLRNHTKLRRVHHLVFQSKVVEVLDGIL